MFGHPVLGTNPMQFQMTWLGTHSMQFQATWLGTHSDAQLRHEFQLGGTTNEHESTRMFYRAKPQRHQAVAAKPTAARHNEIKNNAAKPTAKHKKEKRRRTSGGRAGCPKRKRGTRRGGPVQGPRGGIPPLTAAVWRATAASGDGRQATGPAWVVGGRLFLAARRASF